MLAKIKQKRALAGLAVLAFAFVPTVVAALTLGGGPIGSPAPAPPGTSKPYFKVFGADVMSGGWFASGNSCNTSPAGPYQDPSYASNQDPRAGGILTYTRASKGGASSDYAAFSLGQVEQNSASDYGFYSAGDLASLDKLTFSDSPKDGYSEGSVRQSSCIPDYYNQKSGATSLAGFSPGAFPGSPGAYSYDSSGSATPPALFSNDVTVAAGSKVTIFIKGNIYINHNIVFAADTADNTTKFALVVLGNIYIDPAVGQLDGWYIAQPASNNVSADEGAIWTCHDDSTTNPLAASYITTNCGNELLVNGSLTAKQVNFMRVKGDISGASSSEDNPSGAAASSNIAEIINYTPEMVVGGPFFNSTSTNSFKVQSLVSLPPQL